MSIVKYIELTDVMIAYKLINITSAFTVIEKLILFDTIYIYFSNRILTLFFMDQNGFQKSNKCLLKHLFFIYNHHI